MGYSLNHLVAMVTNNKTDLSHSVYQNYHINIMECDSDESHFLNLESEDLDRLESLADSYFCTRENKEETSDSDCLNEQFVSNTTGDIFFLTRSSQRFGNKHSQISQVTCLRVPNTELFLEVKNN